MERLGHTSPTVALRYQHVMTGRQDAIAAALDQLAEGTDAARRARRGHDGPNGDGDDEGGGALVSA